LSWEYCHPVIAIGFTRQETAHGILESHLLSCLNLVTITCKICLLDLRDWQNFQVLFAQPKALFL
jgi:hypothetical protein